MHVQSFAPNPHHRASHGHSLELQTLIKVPTFCHHCTTTLSTTASPAVLSLSLSLIGAPPRHSFCSLFYPLKPSSNVTSVVLSLSSAHHCDICVSRCSKNDVISAVFFLVGANSTNQKSRRLRVLVS